MTTFTTLSKRRYEKLGGIYYMEEDVKEFIKQLKKELSKKSYNWLEQQKIIDKLAGSELLK